VAEKNVSERP